MADSSFYIDKYLPTYNNIHLSDNKEFLKLKKEGETHGSVYLIFEYNFSVFTFCESSEIVAYSIEDYNYNKNEVFSEGKKSEYVWILFRWFKLSRESMGISY